MFGMRKKINEVFTPRNPDVNADMYIERSGLEKDLYRSIFGSMHSFLFGESGNGKSWMYKKVFSEKNVNYVVANCANASRLGSITEEIYAVCVKDGNSVKIGYVEGKKAGVNALGTAEISHDSEFEIKQTDPLLTAYKALGSTSKGKKSVIVLDNVETIFKNEKLMGELSDIVILLDDPRFAKYQIKFLIVGIPNEVIQYFSTAKNPSSVGNRIEEIPRVAGLEYVQVLELIERGFEKALSIELPEVQKKRLSRHIFDITLGVPQRIHEYCECLAYTIKDHDWVYSHKLLDQADQSWLLKGLRESYTLIESHLNSEETLDGRRNQVIYALGKLATHKVDTNRVGEVVATEFPISCPDSNSGIGQVLANLTKSDKPMLKKVSNSNSYTLCDPRHLMCIRVMLFKDPETEKIRKKGFKLN